MALHMRDGGHISAPCRERLIMPCELYEHPYEILTVPIECYFVNKSLESMHLKL